MMVHSGNEMFFRTKKTCTVKQWKENGEKHYTKGSQPESLYAVSFQPYDILEKAKLWGH